MSNSIGRTHWYLSKAQAEAACLAPSCDLALSVAKLKMPDHGLAERMLDHFRSGDSSRVVIDLDAEFARNPQLREFLSARIERDILSQIFDGADVEGIGGAIWVEQSDYGQSEAGVDQQLALGGTYFEYRVVGTSDDGGLLTELQVSDHYFWSPGEGRPTDCLHRCAVEMVRNHEAAEFHQAGAGSLGVADPREEELFDPPPPEPTEKR